MNEQVTMIILRAVHVLSAVLWTGGAVMLAFFVVPALRTVAPSGAQFMQEMMQRRKLPVYLTALGGLTLLSGITLYARDSMVTGGAFARSVPGRAYGIGAVIAIIAGVVGNAVSAPTAKKLEKLGRAIAESGGPPSPEQRAEMGRLQDKLAGMTKIVAWLLLAATFMMATARYY
jgi:uncharacterized membrane protein